MMHTFMAGLKIEGPQGIPSNRALFSLCALNFFMADVQAGIGPFLGVFLQRHGWQTGPIGSVMTAGGIVGMLATIPAGALIDQTTKKRLFVIVAALCTISASLLLLSSQSVFVVTISQLATALAGAGIGPLMAGMTLGIVHQKGFNAQIGRNQAWNHAGNMVGAALSGWLGWQFGLSAIFFLEVTFGLLAIAAVLLIPEKSIDHQAARGLEYGDSHAVGKAEGIRAFLRHKPLLILAACLCFFHLGNAAMLPLYGMAVVSAGKGNPAMFTAMTVVVAQAVMIGVSLLAMRFVARRGYWIVLLISFAALPLRGVIAGTFIEYWGVWPVQFLDGIGAGLQSVAVPGLVAWLLNGTGRVNMGQGVVMTAQGIGASLSPALGGWLAEGLGYSTAFYTLGCFALLSLGLWVSSASVMRSADRAPA
ncbi:MFS transporter [Komagataeibacter medellinensis]|uniref:Major facilitator superfamily transporter n=1 Tax=Komagataeibacter medellinensis (strain NBRC 3288 / BCRC 11682 / LMG 1693 / Kondo 51) TaxID=634177 RepID=G2I1F5_KOMMN|nr:MFS transporter [Komagataeibacter medellinensis]BAK84763.1 major facilitator superfamily transporter [Komagataeibacter medellinensis NBRC 3288]